MNRVEKISKWLAQSGINSVLLSSRENYRWACPTVIDNALVLITAEGEAHFFTDGRYGVQAKQDLGNKGVKLHLTSSSEMLREALVLAAELGFSLAFEDLSCTYSFYNGLQEGFDGELVPAGNAISALRRKKDKSEIAAIKASLEIAQISLEQTFCSVKIGITEAEVQAILTYNLLKNGSESGNFGIVAVGGQNSALPHGRAGSRALQKGDFLLIDFGAIYQGYYSDITRTVAIGNADEDMRSVYDAVLGANLAGIAAIAPNISACKIDNIAREHLRELGYGEYFVHGLGHGLGLDIHEQPRLNASTKEILQLGDVVTVEPGVYLPGRFGVRIEDVVMVGEDGANVLTAFPKELRII